MSVVALARPEIAALQPYVTAVQKPDTLRLNANEAPRSPLPGGLNRYPQIRPGALQERLATLYATDPGNLLATRGSSEAIDLLIRTFCRAYEDSIVVTPPTFSMYRVYARMQGADVIEVPLQSAADFALDTNAVLASCTDQSKLIFICSPNNPTGGSVPVAAIENLLRARSGRSLVVVDEAYIEFSETESLIRQLDKFDNLVVLRTLSKAWGLAGVRCGAVAARPEIINLLGRMLPPYAFSSPAAKCVLQSLTREATTNSRRQIATTVAERERLRQALDALPGVIKVWPSDSNFLLVRFANLDAVQQDLAQQKILIRVFQNEDSLENCARITVGTADENQRLVDALTATLETC